MKTKIASLAALTLLATLGLTSCQKDSVETEDTQISGAQSATESSGMVEDMGDEAELRISPNSAITGCPTVTFAVPQGQFPNTITIDYGTGCTAQNGRVIAGKVIVDVSGEYMTIGSVRTAHTENLTVDGNGLEYTRTVTNQGLNAQEQMYWTVEVSGTRVRASDGETGTWAGNRVRTLIEGQSTTDEMLDDVYEITGSGSGTCPGGNSFTSSITTPLVKRADCKWPVSGVEQFVMSGSRGTGTRSMDFGDGSCDDKGTVTLPNGSTREVTLHRPRVR